MCNGRFLESIRPLIAVTVGEKETIYLSGQLHHPIFMRQPTYSSQLQAKPLSFVNFLNPSTLPVKPSKLGNLSSAKDYEINHSSSITDNRT